MEIPALIFFLAVWVGTLTLVSSILWTQTFISKKGFGLAFTVVVC